MSRRNRRVAVLAALLGLACALSGASTAGAAESIVFPFNEWAVSGSLTPKKLDEPVILPKGSTFNGVAHVTLSGGGFGGLSGTLDGSLFVPPFEASLRLGGLVPTTVGVTFTQVGEAEGTVSPSARCAELGLSGSCSTLDVHAEADVGITVVGLLGIDVPTQCETSEPIAFDLSDTLTLSEMTETGPRFSGTTTIPSIQCGGLSGLALGVLMTELMSGPDNPYVLHIGPVEPAAPGVLSEPAAAVSQVSAKLSGTVDPYTETVSDCRFEYGRSPSYGMSAPCAPPPGSGDKPVAVSTQLAGLEEGAVYHYRLVAANALGTSYGPDRTFTTLSPSIAPEYGRLVKVRRGVYEWVAGPAPSCIAHKHGEYTDPGCTVKSAEAKKGSYEKEPGPGYTTASAAVTLQVPGLGRTVACSASTGAGEVTGLSVGTERIALTGCETAGRKCTSEGPNATPSSTSGEIITNLLATRLLGPVSEAEVWMQLTSAEHQPYLFEFDCEGMLLRTAGALAGVQTGDVNVSSRKSTTTFAIGRGEQALSAEVSEDAGGSWVGPAPASLSVLMQNTAASKTDIKP